MSRLNEDIGEQGIKDLSKLLIKRCNNEWDAVVCVTGGEGVGKSTFAIATTKEICTQRKMEWVMDKFVIISPNQTNVSESMLKLPKISPITLDEATNSLHKGDWYTKEQKFLNKFFTLARQEFKIVFVLIPRIQDLNKYFREGRIKMWVHILERGTAVLFVKDDNPFTEDPWHFKHAKKMLDKYHNRWMGNIGEKINLLEKLKIYRGFIRFDALSKEDKETYLELKKLKKYKDLVEEESFDIWKQYMLKVYWHLRQRRKEKGSITYEDMPSIIGVDRLSVKEWKRRYEHFFRRIDNDADKRETTQPEVTNNSLLKEKEKSEV